jgi:hypothetical protein
MRHEALTRSESKKYTYKSDKSIPLVTKHL